MTVFKRRLIPVAQLLAHSCACSALADKELQAQPTAYMLAAQP